MRGTAIVLSPEAAPEHPEGPYEGGLFGRHSVCCVIGASIFICRACEGYNSLGGRVQAQVQCKHAKAGEKTILVATGSLAFACLLPFFWLTRTTDLTVASASASSLELTMSRPFLLRLPFFLFSKKALRSASASKSLPSSFE